MPTKSELMDALSQANASDVAMKTVVSIASGNQSALIAVGSGMVALAGVAYVWYRKISADSRDDSTLKLLLTESANASKTWREIAESANQRADAANKRADDQRSESIATIERVAMERNEAVQNAGKLTATVEHLQQTVEKQTLMIQSLEIENVDLHANIEGLSVMLQQVLVNQAEMYDKIMTDIHKETA